MGDGTRYLSVENLIESLQDEDLLVRVRAGFVLGTMGEDALPAIPTLIEMLENGDVQTQKIAALTLGQLGPLAEAAVPALLAAANDDESDDVSDLAIWALEEIDLVETEAA